MNNVAKDEICAEWTSNRARFGFWAGLFIVCSLVFTFQCLSLSQDITVRNGDSLYTIVLADNILSGKGYGLDCVMHFHKRYLRGTWVNDCFRAPLGSVFVAGVEYFSGRSLFWPHAASSFISTFLTPVLVFFLSLELFGHCRGAALGAYATAVHPVLAELAMTNTYDPLGMLLAFSGILFFVQGLRKPYRLLVSGIFFGLACLTKEHYIVVLPLLGMICWGLSWTKRLILPSGFWTKMIAATVMLVAVLVPWRLRCSALPSNDKLSLSDVNHRCGLYNKESFYCDRTPLWLEQSYSIDKVTMDDLVERGETVLRNSVSALYITLINIFIPGDSDLKYASSISCPYYGIPFKILMECEAIVHRHSYFAYNDTVVSNRNMIDVIRIAFGNMTLRGIVDTLLGKNVFTLIIGLLALKGFWTMRREPETMLLGILYLSFTFAISLATFPYIRYLLICYPLLIIIAVEYYTRQGLPMPRTLLSLAMITLLLGYYFIYQDWNSPPPGSYDADIKERKEARTLAGIAAGKMLPKGSVIMANSAIFYHYFSGLPAVEIPAATNSEDQYRVLLEVIAQYKINYILIPKNRLFEDKLLKPIIKILDKPDSAFTTGGLLNTDRLINVDQGTVRRALSEVIPVG